MEIVGQPPAEAEPELHLLTEWADPNEGTRRRGAGVLSIAVHAALILTLVLLPKEFFESPPPLPEAHPHVTPLIDPLTALTQKEPNPLKARKEFDGSEARPHPRLQTPPSPPPAPKPTPPRITAAAPPPTPRATPPPPPPDPVKLDPPKEQPKEQPKLELPPPAPTAIPTPQIQAEERPKSPFERPGGGPVVPVPPTQRQVPLPDTAAVIRGGVSGGMAGSSGATLPSMQAGPGGELELPQLLTDVQGIDFRPYLTRLLFTVKRNWMTVWPESARSGRKGKVGVQFSIGRDGTVQKVVFAYQSGADALDRAAIAAISMSTPFGPLPAQFKGDRVVLQFNFSYNIPKQ